MLATVVAGCSTVAPPYSIGVDNQRALQGAPARSKLAVGAVTAAPGTPAGMFTQPLSARSTEVLSPYSGSWLAYLKQAIEAELRTAGRLDPAARLRIDAELVQNNLSAGGASTGEAELAARFKVFLGEQPRFDKVLRVQHSWEGSFMGAVAIPAAVNNYGTAVQKLLNALFADPEFQQLRE